MSESGIDLRDHMSRHTHDAWGLVLILIFCLAFSLNAQETQNRPVSASSPSAKLSVSLDRAIAPVGGNVNLTLSYALPQGSRLPDKPEIEGLEGLTITGMIREPGTISIPFIVESLTDLAIGPVSLNYLDANGARQKIKADPLILKVTSNLEQNTQRQQLKPIQDIIPLKPLWLPWVLCGVFTIFVLFIIGYIFWYQGRTNPIARQSSDLPPHIRARSDMIELNRSGMFERGEIKAFYFRFSEILKYYLEAMRDFPAAEYTTEEITSRVSAEIDRELVVLLMRADLVKFADDVPSKSRKDEEVMMALSFIAATAPGPEPANDTRENGGNLS